jgi:hypothetical protein
LWTHVVGTEFLEDGYRLITYLAYFSSGFWRIVWLHVEEELRSLVQ